MGPDSSIPGLDINGSKADDDDGGRPGDSSGNAGGRGEGISGWISNIVGRQKDSSKKTQKGQYRAVGQEEDGV